MFYPLCVENCHRFAWHGRKTLDQDTDEICRKLLMHTSHPVGFVVRTSWATCVASVGLARLVGLRRRRGLALRARHGTGRGARAVAVVGIGTARRRRAAVWPGYAAGAAGSAGCARYVTLAGHRAPLCSGDRALSGVAAAAVVGRRTGSCRRAALRPSDAAGFRR